MAKVTILGCGYTGVYLLKRLLSAGHDVAATTMTARRLDALSALGAKAHLASLSDPRTLVPALQDAEFVFHLAPPAPGDQAIVDALGPKLRRLVYGSTTGVYGQVEPSTWIDESSALGIAGSRGQERQRREATFLEAGLPLGIVRIAGIYGPGRTLSESLRSGRLLLFRDGPDTSRVHVEDLARMLEAMLLPDAPPVLLATDDAPAPTLEVAEYTAALLDLPLPPILPLAEATAQLSPEAREMRLGGRRCRSLHRPGLIGPLLFPNYREGVYASLRAEGHRITGAAIIR